MPSHPRERRQAALGARCPSRAPLRRLSAREGPAALPACGCGSRVGGARCYRQRTPSAGPARGSSGRCRGADGAPTPRGGAREGDPQRARVGYRRLRPRPLPRPCRSRSPPPRAFPARAAALQTCGCPVGSDVLRQAEVTRVACRPGPVGGVWTRWLDPQVCEGARWAWGRCGKAGCWARAWEAAPQGPEGPPLAWEGGAGGRAASDGGDRRGEEVSSDRGRRGAAAAPGRVCSRHDPSRLQGSDTPVRAGPKG